MGKPVLLGGLGLVGASTVTVAGRHASWLAPPWTACYARSFVAPTLPHDAPAASSEAAGGNSWAMQVGVSGAHVGGRWLTRPPTRPTLRHDRERP